MHKIYELQIKNYTYTNPKLSTNQITCTHIQRYPQIKNYARKDPKLRTNQELRGEYIFSPYFYSSFLYYLLSFLTQPTRFQETRLPPERVSLRRLQPVRKISLPAPHPSLFPSHFLHLSCLPCWQPSLFSLPLRLPSSRHWIQIIGLASISFQVPSFMPGRWRDDGRTLQGALHIYGCLWDGGGEKERQESGWNLYWR